MPATEEGTARKPNGVRTRASVACIKCRKRKIKCNVQSLKPGERCRLCESVGAECIVKYDDNRRINASKKYVRQLEERVETLESLVNMVGAYEPADGFARGTSQELTTASAMVTEPTLVIGASPMTSASNHDVAFVQEHMLPPTELENQANDHPAAPEQSGYSAAGVLDEMSGADDMSGANEFANGSVPISESHLVDLASSPQVANPASSHAVNRAPSPHVANLTPSLDHEGLPFAGNGESTLNTSEADSQSKRQEGPIPANHSQFNHWNRDIFERHPQLNSQFTLGHDGHAMSYDSNRNYHDAAFPGHWLHTAPMEPYPGPSDTLNDTPEFRLEYLEKWWKFQDMSAHLVDPKLFMAGYEKGVRSQHFSTFTLNAMLACAVRLSKDEPVRKLGGIFAGRAKKQIVKELESPNMATIQGFCLLSDYECTNGSEHVGWIYVGIACRLILDLGLHQDCSDLVGIGWLSKDDAVARQRTTFGCYVYEQVWCVLLGRPSSLKASNLHLPRLHADHSDYDIQLLSAWVDLSSLTNKMVDIFDRPKNHDPKTLEKVKRLREAFQTWQKNLPPKLQWTEQDQTSWPPSLCALSMQFHHVQILYHKTITANRHRFWPDGLSEEDKEDIWPYTPEMSHRIMRENAVKIARTLEIRRLTFEEWGFATLMLDIIFTAASTLITSMTTYGNQSSALQDHKWLICFLEACEGLQCHYPVVQRMLTVLNSLLKSTGLAKFIWRGPSTAPAVSTPSASPPTSNSDYSSPYDGQHTGRAVPFDPQRWCEDRDITAPSASHPCAVDRGDGAITSPDAPMEPALLRSPEGDRLQRWDQMCIFSPLNWEEMTRPMELL